MPDVIRSRATPWLSIILLCGKCARKLDGGFGPNGKDTLRATVRAALTAAGRRRQMRIIETKCLGICPKKAITAVNTSRPDRLLVIPKGTTAEDALRAMAEPPAD